jgi:hypothetical protein
VTVSTSGRRALVVAAVALVVAIFAWSGPYPGGAPDASSPEPSAAPASEPGTGASMSTRAPSFGPSASDAAVLVGAGDIADCSADGDTATADLLESIPGTVFALGDNAYERGSPREYRECYGPTWGRPSILERTRPVPGNHEYRTKDARGYFDYFGAAAGDPSEGWYAFDLGTWRVYALNSNCDQVGGCKAGSPQERWLREDLAANPRGCVAAMWHHPRFSSGEEHGNDPATADLWRTLQEAGAELVLVGHEHMYERFAPQDATGEPDPQRGLVELLVGTGGRNLYGIGEVKANSLVRETATWGVLRLTLRDGGYDFEFVPVAGASFSDAGSGACH